MEMQFVDSSNIERIGYDPDSNTLRIEFKTSGTYDYHNVPESVFDEIKLASSVGRYYAANVKHAYAYTKV